MRFESEIDQEDGRAWTPGRRKVEGLVSRADSPGVGGKKAGKASPDTPIRISRLRRVVLSVTYSAGGCDNANLETAGTQSRMPADREP